MANRYDNAHAYPEQFKLFKFVDVKTSTIFQIIASNEFLAKKILGRDDISMIVRIPMTKLMGGCYA